MTTNTIPTISDKKAAELSFTSFFNSNRSSFGVASWTNYSFEYSHDGLCLYNKSSNTFDFSEIKLIDAFCELNDYTFCAIGRESNNKSGYGSVQIEINLCK